MGALLKSNGIPEAPVFRESLHCASRKHFSPTPSAVVWNLPVAAWASAKGQSTSWFMLFSICPFLEFSVHLLSSWNLPYALSLCILKFWLLKMFANVLYLTLLILSNEQEHRNFSFWFILLSIKLNYMTSFFIVLMLSQLGTNS